MIRTASADLRVDYSIVFEEGELEWYTLKAPNANANANANANSNSKSSHLNHLEDLFMAVLHLLTGRVMFNITFLA